MQHDGKRWGRANKFAIHLDVVARAGLRAEIGADFALNGNPTCCDQFIALPARSDARSGEVAIEAQEKVTKLKREEVFLCNSLTVVTSHFGFDQTSGLVFGRPTTFWPSFH